jgi:hypothetical protein
MSDDMDPIDRKRAIISAAEKMVCEMLGHDWQRVRPKPGTAMSTIIGEHILCIRCGKLNR